MEAFDPDTATLVTRYKSGLYTIERPLELGAVIAGDGELGRRLRAFERAFAVVMLLLLVPTLRRAKPATLPKTTSPT